MFFLLLVVLAIVNDTDVDMADEAGESTTDVTHAHTYNLCRHCIVSMIHYSNSNSSQIGSDKGEIENDDGSKMIIHYSTINIVSTYNL